MPLPSAIPDEAEEPLHPASTAAQGPTHSQSQPELQEAAGKPKSLRPWAPGQSRDGAALAEPGTIQVPKSPGSTTGCAVFVAQSWLGTN